jgi:regulator of protease activity HflC (stomatin/prohibitin superfamily)
MQILPDIKTRLQKVKEVRSVTNAKAEAQMAIAKAKAEAEAEAKAKAKTKANNGNGIDLRRLSKPKTARQRKPKPNREKVVRTERPPKPVAPISDARTELLPYGYAIDGG